MQSEVGAGDGQRSCRGRLGLVGQGAPGDGLRGTWYRSGRDLALGRQVRSYIGTLVEVCGHRLRYCNKWAQARQLLYGGPMDTPMLDRLTYIESYVGKKLAPVVLEILDETNSSIYDEAAIQEAHDLALLDAELEA